MTGSIEGGVPTSEKELRKPVPRITVIGDREWLNTRSIIHYGNSFPDQLQLGGIIIPGGEFDTEIIGLVDQVKNMRSSGTAIPEFWEDEQVPNGVHFYSSEADISFMHAPYDAKQLREDDLYRREYCERLVNYTKSTSPDIIFLSNFKVILHSVFVESFEGKIINVHPSVLPLIKGFKPETRADAGENTTAAGYTFHLVDVDLDGGPTLFQRRVPIDPVDEEEKARLGEKEYARVREERLRLRNIADQAQFTPQVLKYVSSDTHRKILADEEAFTAEDRAEFWNSDEYKKSLKKDFEEWCHSTGQEVSYDEWFALHRKPYRRVLFEENGEWQTLEKIIGVDESKEIARPDGVRRYSFRIHGGNMDTMMRYAELLTEAQELAKQGTGDLLGERAIYYANNGMLGGSFLTSADLSELLEKFGVEKVEVDQMPTRVGVKRQPPFSFDAAHPEEESK